MKELAHSSWHISRSRHRSVCLNFCCSVVQYTKRGSIVVLSVDPKWMRCGGIHGQARKIDRHKPAMTSSVHLHTEDKVDHDSRKK